MASGSRSDFSIEEYEVDSEPPRVYGKIWQIRLRMDGSIAEHSRDNECDITDQWYEYGERGCAGTSGPFLRPGSEGYADVEKLYGFFYGESYVSREHALKLAIEERQKQMREHPELFKKA